MSFIINNNGCVDINDLVTVASSFQTEKGEPNYKESGDWNKDGAIDITDLVAVSSNFGKGNCGGTTTQPTQTPQPSAKTGSCEKSCGGISTKGFNCYCDDKCLSYGDCCDDFKQECPDIYNANK